MKQVEKEYFFWKCTSLIVLVCFTGTTLAWSAPPVDSNPNGLAPHSFAALRKLSLPQELGRIDEVFLPEEVDSDSPFIIYVQDAHANLGAQENIAGIAREFSKVRKIEAIFKEGGSG